RQREWRALFEGIGRPDLATDPRFVDAPARRAHDAALAEILEAAFAVRPAEDWEAYLISLGVGCVRADGPSFGEFLMRAPQIAATSMMTHVVHPELGPIRQHGPLAVLSLTPTTAGPACATGQHTRPILVELDYSPPAIEDLPA